MGSRAVEELAARDRRKYPTRQVEPVEQFQMLRVHARVILRPTRPLGRYRMSPARWGPRTDQRHPQRHRELPAAEHAACDSRRGGD